MYIYNLKYSKESLLKVLFRIYENTTNAGLICILKNILILLCNMNTKEICQNTVSFHVFSLANLK